MRNSAVVIENLGKRYTIGRQQDSGDGLRHAIETAVRSPIAWLRKRREEKSRQVDFWALRNVSLEVKHGEVVGIMGRNGAGKSTLLKLLSRITVPTEGSISISGRVASLLEVGTGFHPELTGRENIFLNGAILGMSRMEIIRKFDEIVAFSEIENFLDTPVKRYSSGMYVRLAFSVAAHLDPEILIVDEVLAVGDTAFQKKCLGKIGSFAQDGRTVLFVSHNLDAIRALCQRCVWMKDGGVHRDGNAEEVVDDYFSTVIAENSQYLANPGYGLSIDKIAIKNGLGEECNEFLPGEDLVVELSLEAQKRLEKPHVILSVSGVNGTCFTANMLLDGRRPSALFGKGLISCRFKGVPLLPQKYTVKLSIRASDADETIVGYQEVAQFSVVADLAKYGFRGEFLSRASSSTPVIVPYEWILPDGEVEPVSLSPRGHLEQRFGESEQSLVEQ